MNDLASRLKRLRLSAGLTQAQAADAAEISVRRLSELETGQPNPHIGTLEALLTIYGVKLDIVPAGEWTPEHVEGLVLLVQAGRNVKDVAKDMFNENAGSAAERLTTLARMIEAFEKLEAVVSKKEDGNEG